VAVSGNRGPDGGSAEKPLVPSGLPWTHVGGETFRQQALQGSRRECAAQTVLHALEGLLEVVERRSVKPVRR